MVSASLLGSSIWLSETMTSGGIFLLMSFMYCSNCDTTVRTSAGASGESAASSGTVSAAARKNSGFSAKERMRARQPPSTSTLTLPSGSLSSCRTVLTVPTR